MTSDVYTEEFFRTIEEGALRSAREVVPMVMNFVQPRSVVDVGCGTGAWLSVFAESGVEDVFGVDGDYVPRDALRIPPDRFHVHDLSEPLQLERTFDLVASLEVAEHLPPDSASTFVDSLTRLGPVVLFSAAIPYQVGTGHLNLQWPDYWAWLFSERGYEVRDVIRPRVWANENVDPWYAQNILLFAREDYLRELWALMRERRPELRELRIVHPTIFEWTVQDAQRQVPSPRSLLGRLPATIGRRVKRARVEGSARPEAD
ncbi:MAG: class I SAM-dependent methyltransferase [Actinomycetota bacterium]|nr:class I SAM-dependent methyltransferase [Actinomycetota bacterium]